MADILTWYCQVKSAHIRLSRLNKATSYPMTYFDESRLGRGVVSSLIKCLKQAKLLCKSITYYLVLQMYHILVNT